MKQITAIDVEKTLNDYLEAGEQMMIVLKDENGLKSAMLFKEATSFEWHNPYGLVNDLGARIVSPYCGSVQVLEVYLDTPIKEMLFYMKTMANKEIVIDTRVMRKVKVANDSFMLKGYACDTVYTGRAGYHSHHGSSFNAPLSEYDGYKIGVELEVECTTESKFREVTAMKSNFIYMESDGSLGSYGVELITIPLLPKDAKRRSTWDGVVRFLSSRAKSWSTGRCGLHVHIGREILGKDAEEQSETVGKMLFLYHQYLKDDATNKKIYGRDRAYNDHDGKTREGSAVELLGSSILKQKDIKEKVKKAMIDRSSTDRYFDINLRNTATIEFRKGRGSINTNRICAIVEYSELIALYARKAKWEKLSKEAFFDFCRSKIKATSPLYEYLGACESCQ